MIADILSSNNKKRTGCDKRWDEQNTGEEEKSVPDINASIRSKCQMIETSM